MKVRSVNAARDKHADAKDRVDFLSQGLKHARLCAQVSAQLSLANATPSPTSKSSLNELLAFRRATERTNLSNYNHLAWVEDLSWKLGDEVKKAPELYP